MSDLATQTAVPLHPHMAGERVLTDANKPRLIALASGKGGVGKTWLSLTLAQALSCGGRRVLVFDADFGLANADIQLGHLSGFDLAAVMSGTADLRDSIATVPHGGFDLIAGQSGSGSLAGLSIDLIVSLLKKLALLALDYDVILFDLGTGVEPVTRYVAAHADTVILLTTEDPSSLTDAYAVLKLLKRDREALDRSVDARVVVNQTRSEPAGKRAHAAFARASRGFLRLDPPLLGTIARDERVGEAIRCQRLLLSQFPQSPAGRSVVAIARRLMAR
jgi:flagellar biosynthesis protein FlhG